MSLLAAKKKRLARQQAEAEAKAKLLAEAEEKDKAEEALKEVKEEVKRPKGNPFVYLDFSIVQPGDGKPRRVIFELFADVVPKTAENFRCLCTGERGKGNRATLHYKSSPVHRVVPGFAIEGGDIEQGTGDGGESIYGDGFEDEGYSIKHDAPGVLTSAKIDAGKTCNASQFMVTMARAPQVSPCTQCHAPSTAFFVCLSVCVHVLRGLSVCADRGLWGGQLDGKHVAFGRVVRGMEVLVIDGVDIYGYVQIAGFLDLYIWIYLLLD